MTKIKEIKVPLTARISETEVRGIPIKGAFYTAGYPEGSTIRYVKPMNHGLTYVIDGKQWGIASDLLVRSGNGLSGIKPEVLRIDESRKERDFVVYRGQRLSRRVEEKVLDEFGFRINYGMMSNLRGIKSGMQRLTEILGAN